MAEELSIEQTAQLLQMKEPLDIIDRQIWRLRVSPSLSRAEVEQIANNLDKAHARIGSSVLALMGASDQSQQLEDIELPAFMSHHPQAAERP